MEHNSPALILRIFVSSTDKYKDGLLYEHLVLTAEAKVLLSKPGRKH